MYIKPLDRETYTDFELHYTFHTDEHYAVTVVSEKDRMRYELTRERYGTTRFLQNTDILYEDTFPNAEAYAVCEDGTDTVLGYLEVAFEEWNNRLRMTQLLVDEKARGKGVGTFLMNFVKDMAKERDYRVIVLETQNYNVPAIDFYRRSGFVFSGGNVYFYSNCDIEDDEVMLEMSYLVE